MIDEFVVSALANIPFAVVLALYLVLDFKHRGSNVSVMRDMVEAFTEALRQCCDDDK